MRAKLPAPVFGAAAGAWRTFQPAVELPRRRTCSWFRLRKLPAHRPPPMTTLVPGRQIRAIRNPAGPILGRRCFSKSMSCESISRITSGLAPICSARRGRLITAAVMIFVATVAAATFAATASALVLIGLGSGLGELLGGRTWLGNTLVGALVLIVIGLGGVGAARWLNYSSRMKTIRSYAQRRDHASGASSAETSRAVLNHAKSETEFLAQQAAEARLRWGPR